MNRVPSFVNIVYCRSSKHIALSLGQYIVYMNVFGAAHYSLNPISFASNFHAILYRKILSTLRHEEPICEKLNLRRFARIPNIRTHLRNSNNCCSLRVVCKQTGGASGMPILRLILRILLCNLTRRISIMYIYIITLDF